MRERTSGNENYVIKIKPTKLARVERCSQQESRWGFPNGFLFYIHSPFPCQTNKSVTNKVVTYRLVSFPSVSQQHQQHATYCMFGSKKAFPIRVNFVARCVDFPRPWFYISTPMVFYSDGQRFSQRRATFFAFVGKVFPAVFPSPNE